jgi:hypothetical protein
MRYVSWARWSVYMYVQPNYSTNHVVKLGAWVLWPGKRVNREFVESDASTGSAI